MHRLDYIESGGTSTKRHLTSPSDVAAECDLALAVIADPGRFRD